MRNKKSCHGAVLQTQDIRCGTDILRQHHVRLKGCVLGPHTYVRSRCPPLQVQCERTVFKEGRLVEIGITELHTCNVQA